MIHTKSLSLFIFQWWKGKKRLLVSSPVYKKLGSCRSNLTISKRQKSTHLLRPKREVKSQGKMLLPKLERPTGKYWESQLTGAATSVGTSTKVGKPELWFTNCWSLSVENSENSRGPQSLGASTYLWVLPSGSPPGSHSKHWRKIPPQPASPPCFWQNYSAGTILE